jgi:hypothetical protein
MVLRNKTVALLSFGHLLSNFVRKKISCVIIILKERLISNPENGKELRTL